MHLGRPRRFASPSRCGGSRVAVPEFSVVFRFRAYSRRHETEPESISPQDVLRPGGRRARWLLRDGAVQRQSAVQRVAKIGILERGHRLWIRGIGAVDSSS